MQKRNYDIEKLYMYGKRLSCVPERMYNLYQQATLYALFDIIKILLDVKDTIKKEDNVKCRIYGD